MLIALFLLASAPDIGVFDRPALFSPPLAYPRSPELGIDMRLTSGATDFVAVFGARLPGVTVTFAEHALQVGLDAAAFTGLGVSPGGLFPVYTVDYLAALPLMYRYQAISAELVASHISAHKADGLAPIADPQRYSIEFIHARVAFEQSLGPVWIRTYVGGGTLVRATRGALQTGFLGGGVELTGPWLGRAVRPLFAADVTWHGENAAIDSSAELGFWLWPTRPELLQARFTLGFYSGKEQSGQLLEQRQERIALGFHVRFGEAAHGSGQ